MTPSDPDEPGDWPGSERGDGSPAAPAADDAAAKDASGTVPEQPPTGPEEAAESLPSPAGAAGTEPDADAAWDDIVAHFGERATLEPDELAEPTVPGSPRGIESLGDPSGHVDLGIEEVSDLARDPDESFTPPPPPRVAMPEPRRLLAWLGLLGVPALVVLAVLLQVHLPVWGGFLLMCWFIGGFTYLVGTMRPGPRDDWDDGAVL